MKNVSGLWAITWRSVVFLPVTVIVGITWLMVGLSIIFLPLAVAMFAHAHLWRQAVESLAAWIVLFTLWRLFRFGRLWEDPPSFL